MNAYWAFRLATRGRSARGSEGSTAEPPRLLASCRPAATYAAAILGALGALAVLAVAVVWLYDHRNGPVLIPVGIAYLTLDVGMHWTSLRRWVTTREIAERAADDADRALGVQLAQADTVRIPVVVHDLPRRPRPHPDDVDEQLKRFRFEGGSRA